jgi:hypothetical protein
MAYTAILNWIRLLIPAEREGHYHAVRRGFEEGDLTAPNLPISDMQLARAISEFTSLPPEASIDTRETTKGVAATRAGQQDRPRPHYDCPRCPGARGDNVNSCYREQSQRDRPFASS